MKLEQNRNYIVSGLERSGTSMMMQILEAGKIPIAHNKSRNPDENNPKGYYELEGGKVISKLMENKFPMRKYRGKFIKITSYGLLCLPNLTRKYTIIYMERDIDEIIKSTEKMTGKKTRERVKTIKSLEKLEHKVKEEIISRVDCRLLILNYNNILEDPKGNVEMILDYLELKDTYIDDMVEIVNKKLYRNRK